MKEDLTEKGMQKQYDDLKKILRNIRRKPLGKKYRLEQWNHADFELDSLDDFIDFRDLLEINDYLKLHGRNIVLLEALSRDLIEIVTLESTKSPNERMRPWHDRVDHTCKRGRRVKSK